MVSTRQLAHLVSPSLVYFPRINTTNHCDRSQGYSRRPVGGEKKSRGFGRSKGTADVGDGRGAGGGRPQVKKAVFETTKKKEIGVSDLTLLSKISNEAINDNLKLRFDHGEIYVRLSRCICCYGYVAHTWVQGLTDGRADRPILDTCWCLSTPSETVRQFHPTGELESMLLMACSGYLHRPSSRILPQQEPTRSPAPCLRRGRIRLPQYELLQRQPVCDHFRGVGSWKDRSCEADYAVHRQCLWRL